MLGREEIKHERLLEIELIQRLDIAESEIQRLVRELYELRSLKVTDEQIRLLLQEQLESQREDQYGASSERYKKPAKKPDGPKAPPKPRVKQPSERYPGLPIQERCVIENPAPSCPCCNKERAPSGMTGDSEQLTVIPKRYEIPRLMRMKYRCSCQGAVITVPSPPRIIPGSTYSDEMIVDVALSKYCDLIPMERYSAMAARGGVKDLPPQSLIWDQPEVMPPDSNFHTFWTGLPMRATLTIIAKGRASTTLPSWAARNKSLPPLQSSSKNVGSHFSRWMTNIFASRARTESQSKYFPTIHNP